MHHTVRMISCQAEKGRRYNASNKIVCQITDKNISNNMCQCSAAPPINPKKPPKARTS